ncbi:MAG: GNAT family N-acetyltransferase [Chloroflexi bacterium]|nr:MAG: GNAT family N-acetyltransferase [Chloroflexota bacterium]TMF06634.1 MAG: GNAT family N-acetyltransferase [Chloroflexota bacterium]
MTRKKHELHVNASPDVVWQEITKQGRNDWYFLLDVDGTFATGERVVWKAGGEFAEEADVVEADPPRRLELRTRLLFAPNLAALPPHLLVWEVVPDNGGSLVTLSWDATPLAGNLYESEGEGILRGLRLAVDPSARAELKRLPEIGEIDVRDVTPERVADYLDFFDHSAFRDFPAWQSCYCMETHRDHTDEEWSERTGVDNRTDMQAMIRDGRVTALLAYVDGKPVGWCNYGETTRLSGVMMKLKLDAAEHSGVGSIACFVIAAPYRGHGVATKLLDAALERLKARGLRAVEAYPRRQEDSSAQANYRGSLRMYENAGFEPYRETERNFVVRKTL